MDAREAYAVRSAIPAARNPYLPPLAHKSFRQTSCSSLTQGGSPVREIRTPGSVRGAPARVVPTGTEDAKTGGERRLATRSDVNRQDSATPSPDLSILPWPRPDCRREHFGRS